MTVEKSVIEDQLRWDTRVIETHIDVDVEDGHVTLSGKVPTYLDRMIAENDVRHLPGVRSVINQLIVEYPMQNGSPSDEEVREYISGILRGHPTIDESNVQVMVSSGHVQLEGTVGSYWHKVLVDDIVASASGVVEISNRLAVVPYENAADEDTAKDIMNAMHRSPLIDAGDINVKVEEGRVTLSGSVPTADAYRAANDAAAYTFGVIEVTNHVVIDPV